MDPKLEKKLARLGDIDKAYDCTWSNRPAVVAFVAGQVAIVGLGFAQERAAAYNAANIIDRHGVRRTLRLYGMEEKIEFAAATIAEQFDRDLATRRRTGVAHDAPYSVQPVSRDRVTTLQILPGYVIVKVIGVTTELNATSGFTATSKGTHALETAMEALRVSAGRAGANAIVGLSASAFGAHGGITNALGGDAVGVLLVGTAVCVEPSEPGSAGAGAAGATPV